MGGGGGSSVGSERPDDEGEDLSAGHPRSASIVPLGLCDEHRSYASRLDIRAD